MVFLSIGDGVSIVSGVSIVDGVRHPGGAQV